MAIYNYLQTEVRQEDPRGQGDGLPRPPPIRGVGRAGGFMLMVEDRGDMGSPALQAETGTAGRSWPTRAAECSADDRLPRQRAAATTSTRSAAVRDAARPSEGLFRHARIYQGSLYVNDFNKFGRTWQVIVQADPSSAISLSRHLSAQSPQQRRRDGRRSAPWPRFRGSQRAPGPDPLQHVSRRLGQRHGRPGRQLRTRPSH